MLVLVTRPQPGAGETARRLRDLGHDVLVNPLTAIVYAPPPASLPRPAALAFTSGNAVRALAGWPMSGGWQAVPVFAVGAATAAAARAAGFADVHAASGDLSGLAAEVRAGFDPQSGTLLYPAGRERSGDLAAELDSAGIRTITVEAYHAVPAEHFDPAVLDALRAGRVDAALFHSRRSAIVFAGIIAASGVEEGLRSTRLLALSERVAEPLRGLSAASVEIAARPDESALAALARARPQDGRGPIRTV
jgi:uroporphyrinogen-III synthase